MSDFDFDLFKNHPSYDKLEKKSRLDVVEAAFFEGNTEGMLNQRFFNKF